jgi:hypothetical protein
VSIPNCINEITVVRMVLFVHLLLGGPRLRIHVSHCLRLSQIFCLPPFVFKTRPETLIEIWHT